MTTLAEGHRNRRIITDNSAERIEAKWDEERFSIVTYNKVQSRYNTNIICRREGITLSELLRDWLKGEAV